MEPALSVVVMTPTPAPPAPEGPAETAVVPERAVTTAVAVAPAPLAAAATSVKYRQHQVTIIRRRLNEPPQKLFPAEMIGAGSTPAAVHTGVEQSRTPKPKSMFVQRQA